MGSPFTPSSSSTIPFSWEKQPGIPKIISAGEEPKSEANKPTLPLPPHLRCNSGGFLSVPRKKWSYHVNEEYVCDPFQVALEECSKGKIDNQWKMTGPPKVAGNRRGKRDHVGGGFCFGMKSLELYGSCKNNCSVADSVVYVPQSDRSMAVYRVLNRRRPTV